MNPIYQFDPHMKPDADFHPGDLKFLVRGNTARLLDPRRTPLRVVEIREALGLFVVEILDFEDRGARWELPFEDAGGLQFTKDSAEANSQEISRFRDVIARLDQPLHVPINVLERPKSDEKIASLRASIRTPTQFGEKPDFSSNTGNPRVWADFQAYMKQQDLWDLEQRFAAQYVSNPHSGEFIKGHQIVLAELGFVPFQGKKIRDPELFNGASNKERRVQHILHRLAFIREMFEAFGIASVVLYRGASYQQGEEQRSKKTFVSATFSREVALSHFDGLGMRSDGILVRQTVPIQRLFMTYLETAQMNQQYKEAEAILLADQS
jgi:hypothetical protein